MKPKRKVLLRLEKRIEPPGRTITTIAIFLCVCGVVLVIGGLLMWLNHALS